MKNTRIIWGVIIVIALAIAGYWGYQKYLAPQPEAAALAATPAPAEAPQPISAEGKVVPASQVSLAFTQGGRVAEVLVEEGDAVKAGDPLARLDTAALEAAAAQAQAGLDMAQASLHAAQAGLDVAQANLQAANTQLERAAVAALAAEAAWRAAAWTTDLPDEIAQPGWYFDKTERMAAAQAEVDAAQAALDAEQSNLQAVLQSASSADLLAAEKRLADAQAAFLTAKDVRDQAEKSNDKALKDQAQAVLDAAQSELEAAQAEYDQLLSTQAAADVLEARARLAVAQERYDTAIDYLNRLLTGDESLEVKAAEDTVAQAEAAVAQAEAAVAQAEAAVAQAQAALDAANVALDQATLKAPMDGVAMQVEVATGETATPGLPVILLADLSSWKVETTDLSESDVALLSPGMKATIKLDAFPNQTFEGIVRQIALVSQDERGSVTYTVTLDFEPGEAAVRWGMTAYVDIEMP